jgi:iron(III) transport system ATP-binding protein
VARALAPSPEVVLLDEPFSALDTGLRSALRDEISETLRRAGTTAMLVTHDQVEAMTMSDTLAVMKDGRLVQVGRPDAVYRRPLDAWIARFLGDAVLLPARRSGDDRLDGPLGSVGLAPGFDHHGATDVVMFCRPEQLRPVGQSESGADAKVTAVRFQGPDAMVSLSIDGHLVAARWPSALLPEVGDVVRVALVGEVLAYAPDAVDDARAASDAVSSDSDADDLGPDYLGPDDDTGGPTGA